MWGFWHISFICSIPEPLMYLAVSRIVMDCFCLLTQLYSGLFVPNGAKLAIPGVVDLSELAVSHYGVTRIVPESVQDMLLKMALQMARDDYAPRQARQRQGVELAKASDKYKGQRPDSKTQEHIIVLRESGMTIAHTASLAGWSVSQVKRIWSIFKAGKSAQSLNI